MAIVPLDFLPPLENNIIALRIFESPAQDGSFLQIERTTDVGTYPNYITKYTTDLATSVSDWFAIQWEDSDGVLSEISAPVKGGTRTLVQELIDRLLLRDSTLNENIAGQEAEAVVSTYFGTDSPYTIEAGATSPAIMSGLTLLALAQAYLFSTVTSAGSVQRFTAGLVSMDQGSSSSSSQRGLNDLEKMIKMANGMLGRNYSIVALMEEIEVANGVTQLVATDLSRSIIEVQ